MTSKTHESPRFFLIIFLYFFDRVPQKVFSHLASNIQRAAHRNTDSNNRPATIISASNEISHRTLSPPRSIHNRARPDEKATHARGPFFPRRIERSKKGAHRRHSPAKGLNGSSKRDTSPRHTFPGAPEKPARFLPERLLMNARRPPSRKSSPCARACVSVSGIKARLPRTLSRRSIWQRGREIFHRRSDFFLSQERCSHCWPSPFFFIRVRGGPRGGTYW